MTARPDAWWLAERGRDRPADRPHHASAFPDRATGAHRAETLIYPCGAVQMALFIGEGFYVTEDALKGWNSPESAS